MKKILILLFSLIPLICSSQSIIIDNEYYTFNNGKYTCNNILLQCFKASPDSQQKLFQIVDEMISYPKYVRTIYFSYTGDTSHQLNAYIEISDYFQWYIAIKEGNNYRRISNIINRDTDYEFFMSWQVSKNRRIKFDINEDVKTTDDIYLVSTESWQVRSVEGITLQYEFQRNDQLITTNKSGVYTGVNNGIIINNDKLYVIKLIF